MEGNSVLILPSSEFMSLSVKMARSSFFVIIFILVCSDESKAGPFKAPERFTYVSDTTSVEKPSCMRKFVKCWTHGASLLCTLFFQKLCLSEEF